VFVITSQRTRSNVPCKLELQRRFGAVRESEILCSQSSGCTNGMHRTGATIFPHHIPNLQRPIQKPKLYTEDVKWLEEAEEDQIPIATGLSCILCVTEMQGHYWEGSPRKARSQHRLQLRLIVSILGQLDSAHSRQKTTTTTPENRITIQTRCCLILTHLYKCNWSEGTKTKSATTVGTFSFSLGK